MSDPRFPVGKFHFSPFRSESDRQAAIAEIRDLPRHLKAALEALGEDKLDTPYRDGGWTVRQLVHHIADSHMNAFIRLRLGLTEDKPTVKPYNEQLWAELPDATLPISFSVAIIENLHHRMTVMLELTPAESFSRELVHPDNGVMSLDHVLQMYAWHGRHHVAHIVNAPR
ncbi:MAG: putative metal-dependent hydrolase [Acidobacteria bacterium]|nr:putative metal-dependent hydrolase [Acidobacteriota bacterium]